MCWICYDEKPIKRIATENLTVYKVMQEYDDDNCFLSYYFAFWYRPNKLYAINSGLTVIEDDYVYGHKRYMINEGFHSYKFYEKANWGKRQLSSTAVVVECIIPKGSEYYYNGYDDVVSNQIIIKKSSK